MSQHTYQGATYTLKHTVSPLPIPPPHPLPHYHLSPLSQSHRMQTNCMTHSTSTRQKQSLKINLQSALILQRLSSFFCLVLFSSSSEHAVPSPISTCASCTVSWLPGHPGPAAQSINCASCTKSEHKVSTVCPVQCLHKASTVHHVQSLNTKYQLCVLYSVYTKHQLCIMYKV